MKKTTAIIFVILILLGMTCHVYAIEETTPEQGLVIEEYLNTKKAEVLLSINSAGTATVKITCVGLSGTTHISSTTYLERWNGTGWTRVSFNGMSQISDGVSGSYLTRTYTTTVGSGQYRAITTFTVTKGVDEIITITSNYVTH